MPKLSFAGAAVAVGACAVAFFGTPAAAGAAEVEAQPGQANVLCFWDDVNFRGDVECVGVGNNDLDALAGKAKSLSNDTGRPLCVFDREGQQGASLAIPGDHDIVDLSDVYNSDGKNWSEAIHSSGSCPS